MTRIEPLPPSEWPREMQGALAALRPPVIRNPMPAGDPDRPKGLNVLGTLAHHPEATRAFHTLTGHVLFGSTLSPRQRELLVLRVASVRRCDYEWAQHVVLARDAGLTDEEIEQVAAGGAAGGWSPLEGALLAAVDELLADARIGDTTWAALAGDLGEQELLDLVLTVGTYDLLAMVLRSAGTELDGDLQHLARKRPSP